MMTRKRCLSFILIIFGLSWSLSSLATGQEELFIKAYRQAHEQKNLKALLGLVYWQGVDPAARQMVTSNFKDELKLKLNKLEMLPPPADLKTQYTLAGQSYKTNLTIKKVLMVHFRPQAGISQVNNTRYLLGEKAGRYYITTAVKTK
jgi:hypothetical protein